MKKNLFEESYVVGVVVVGEVEDAGVAVLAEPRQRRVAIGHAARFRPEPLVFIGHLSCN